jgi:hypothetical protein
MKKLFLASVFAFIALFSVQSVSAQFSLITLLENNGGRNVTGNEFELGITTDFLYTGGCGYIFVNGPSDAFTRSFSTLTEEYISGCYIWSYSNSIKINYATYFSVGAYAYDFNPYTNAPMSEFQITYVSPGNYFPYIFVTSYYNYALYLYPWLY